MKIKTTMLSGVAGALALAAFLSAPAYGAAHLIVPDVPDLESPLDEAYLDTSAGPITLNNQIQGDVEITNILPSDEGPEPTDLATVWIHQDVLETETLDPIDTEDQPYQQTLTPLTEGDLAGLNLLTSPISYGGENNSQVEGESGVIMDTDGNVWLNSSSVDSQSYKYDTTLYSYTFGTGDVDGDGDSLNGAPVYIDDADNILYIETRPERGGSLDDLPPGAVLLTDEAVGVWVPNENTVGGYDFVAYDGLAVDGGELTAGFKTFLEGYADVETRFTGDDEGTTYFNEVIGDPSGGNLYVEGNAQVLGQLAVGDIPDVEAAIGDNVSAIAVNASDIDVNASDIMVNASDIDVNASDIMVNASDIDVNASDIMVNASDIDVNEAAIMVNASDIDVNEAAIMVNASDIDVNEAAIMVNASDIDLNEAAIAVNASDIDLNEAAIAVNASDIDVNAAAIMVNASDIDVNAAGIATNASDIDVNEAGIAENAADIDDLEGLIFVDPHGNTHISGPNSDSLYTRYDEEDGNQKLGAIHDMDDVDHPNIVDIDVVTNLNVSGAVTNDGPATLTVQKNDGETTITASDDFTPIEPVFDADGVVAGTVAVYTKINENTSLTASTDNSGFYADTEGNVRLFKNGGSDTTLDYVTAIRVDVYDDTNVEGVAGTVANQTEVGGYFDADGNFVVLGELVADGTVDGIGVLDESVFDDATLAAMADLGLYTIDTVDGDGGNLVVEGDSTLMGNLELGEIADVEDAIGMNTAGVAANASTLVVHEGLVLGNQADIATNVSDIAVNAAGVAANASTLVVHEGLVLGNQADIATNVSNIAVNAAGVAANASTLVVHEGLVLANQADIATNVSDIAVNAAGVAANASTLVVHEGLVLQNQADITTNENAIADAVGRLDYHEGLVLANIDDISDLQSEVASINSTLDTHFSLVSQNIQNIEKNTRGIAMTAALTHTTILPGMENALDVSMAYFEGETGIAISYSRRINEGTQINFAAASTSDFEETVVRGGVGWQW